MAKRPQKARRRRLAGLSNLSGWLMRHAQVSLASLGQLSRSPLPTMMTAAVLGIALALPAGLHLLLGNLQQLAGNLSGSASISLFLHQEVSDQRARELAEELRAWPQVEEFRRLSGFGEALEALEENPLPAVLIVEPAPEHTEPAAAERLLAGLRDLAEADIVQLDLQWVRRFAAFTEIARRGVLVLASLLALAVLLILGNTIRLEIQNRHQRLYPPPLPLPWALVRAARRCHRLAVGQPVSVGPAWPGGQPGRTLRKQLPPAPVAARPTARPAQRQRLARPRRLLVGRGPSPASGRTGLRRSLPSRNLCGQAVGLIGGRSSQLEG